MKSSELILMKLTLFKSVESWCKPKCADYNPNNSITKRQKYIDNILYDGCPSYYVNKP